MKNLTEREKVGIFLLIPIISQLVTLSKTIMANSGKDLLNADPIIWLFAISTIISSYTPDVLRQVN